MLRLCSNFLRGLAFFMRRLSSFMQGAARPNLT